MSSNLLIQAVFLVVIIYLFYKIAKKADRKTQPTDLATAAPDLLDGCETIEAKSVLDLKHLIDVTNLATPYESPVDWMSLQIMSVDVMINDTAAGTAAELTAVSCDTMTCPPTGFSSGGLMGDPIIKMAPNSVRWHDSYFVVVHDGTGKMLLMTSITDEDAETINCYSVKIQYNVANMAGRRSRIGTAYINIH